MPATAAWLASLEALLNRSIDGSAQAAALTRRLQGTSLDIDAGITRVRARAVGSRLVLLASDETSADAVISGSLPALLQLLRGGAAPLAGKAAAAVSGNAEVANLYRSLFLLARPDPEEELSRWIGDFAARRVSRFAGQTIEFARRVRRTAGENIAEYLQEESRDLVNGTELEEFLRGVDDVRETADRIEARLERLGTSAKGTP